MTRFNNTKTSAFQLLPEFPDYLILLAGDREREFLTKGISVNAQYLEPLRFRQYGSLRYFFKYMTRCFENTRLKLKEKWLFSPEIR